MGFIYLPSLAGFTTGPSSSTDDAIVRWDGTTGRIVADSTIQIQDDGDLVMATDGVGNIGELADGRPGWAYILSGINLDALTASKALVSDASKNIVSSAVDSADLVTLTDGSDSSSLHNHGSGADHQIARFNGSSAFEGSLIQINDAGDFLPTGAAIGAAAVGSVASPFGYGRFDVNVKVGGADITSTTIGNWNTAYGWGDHAGLYDPVGTAASAISTHETTYNHGNYDTHLGSSSNPHSVTFTQAVTADGSTDISAAEAETLTDGSDADALHTHGSFLTAESDPDSLHLNGDNSPSAAIDFGAQNLTNVGLLRVADGGFTAPSLSFENDPNSGFYSSAADTIAFITGGQSRGSLSTSLWGFNVDVEVQLGSDLKLSNQSASEILVTDASKVVVSSGEASSSIANWNTAYGWGNHASAGYITKPITSANDNRLVRVDASDALQDSGITIDDSDNMSGVANLDITGQMASAHDTETQAASAVHTIDWNDGNSTTWDLQNATGDVTLTMSNPKAGASYVIVVIQGSTDRNITWPGNVKWVGGTAPTITTGTDKEDVISLFYDGTNYFGNFIQDLS